MDLEGHYPQNTMSHYIILNETQITLHFFQGRISAMPEIRADLFLAISKTGMFLLTVISFSNVLLFWFPADQGLKKVDFSWFVGFVALRPKSTAMVIAGRSVHLTTLFPGQA